MRKYIHEYRPYVSRLRCVMISLNLPWVRYLRTTCVCSQWVLSQVWEEKFFPLFYFSGVFVTLNSLARAIKYPLCGRRWFIIYCPGNNKCAAGVTITTEEESSLTFDSPFSVFFIIPNRLLKIHFAIFCVHAETNYTRCFTGFTLVFFPLLKWLNWQKIVDEYGH